MLGAAGTLIWASGIDSSGIRVVEDRVMVGGPRRAVERARKRWRGRCPRDAPSWWARHSLRWRSNRPETGLRRVGSAARREPDRVVGVVLRGTVPGRVVVDAQDAPLGARDVVRDRHVEGAPAARPAGGHRHDVGEYVVVAVEDRDPEGGLEDVAQARDADRVAGGGAPGRTIDPDRRQLVRLVFPPH